MASEGKPNLRNFKLLLFFMKGDSRIPDAFHWGFSVQAKVNAVGILHEEVLSQIPKCCNELEVAEKAGMGEAIQCLILAIKYEVFLNSIYALCENLSYLVHYLCRKKVPLRFKDQKKKFLANKDIDLHYSMILEQTAWYDEIHTMRSEATHFLSGMIILPSPGKPGYFNLGRSQKQGTPENIQIADIERHVRELFQSVLKFISEFGNNFVKVIDQDCRVAQICLVDRGLIGTKLISLKEFLSGQAGVCQTTALDCPMKNSCKARENSA